MRCISIFGSTGSIGQNTIDLIQRAGGPQAFDTVVLSGGRNVALLAQQARDLRAQLAVTCYPECFEALADLLAGTGIEVAAGQDAIAEAATRPADWVMSAIVGTDGLIPSLAALKQGATLALANKESLVTAGPLLLAQAKATGATILPVDSEHSAIFQALVGEDIAAVDEITITASGGAFRDWPLEKMHGATPEQAARHPSWDMGQRITVDSASMFNKALEVIEVKEFFGVSPDQIKVLMHPQSLIHALVSFRDGATMAHLGAPDMRHAIGYALNWPERAALPVPRLDLAQVGQLQFSAPDLTKYPALALAYRVMQQGGLSGAAFTAAKDRALDAFLERRIGFMQMAQVVERTLDSLSRENGHIKAPITLENVRKIDDLARVRADDVIRSLPALRTQGLE